MSGDQYGPTMRVKTASDRWLNVDKRRALLIELRPNDGFGRTETFVSVPTDDPTVPRLACSPIELAAWAQGRHFSIGVSPEGEVTLTLV